MYRKSLSADSIIEREDVMKRLIYLDHAATTQPFPEVLEAMLPFYGRYYGNKSR